MDRIEKAQAALANVQKQLADAKSEASARAVFGTPEPVFLVLRHSMENGRVEEIGPVFYNRLTAEQYITNVMKGYGLDKDLFVREIEGFL